MQSECHGCTICDGPTGTGEDLGMYQCLVRFGRRSGEEPSAALCVLSRRRERREIWDLLGERGLSLLPLLM